VVQQKTLSISELSLNYDLKPGKWPKQDKYLMLTKPKIKLASSNKASTSIMKDEDNKYELNSMLLTLDKTELSPDIHG
jgi:hypothetical protein